MYYKNRNDFVTISIKFARSIHTVLHALYEQLLPTIEWFTSAFAYLSSLPQMSAWGDGTFGAEGSHYPLSLREELFLGRRHLWDSRAVVAARSRQGSSYYLFSAEVFLVKMCWVLKGERAVFVVPALASCLDTLPPLCASRTPLIFLRSTPLPSRLLPLPPFGWHRGHHGALTGTSQAVGPAYPPRGSAVSC